MNTVNPFFLHTLLEPLTGLADDDEATQRFQSFNPNNQMEVRSLVREILKPHFDALDGEVKARAKTALSYYLMNGGVDLRRVIDSSLPPFPAPVDARGFFLVIWRELFPTESIGAGLGPLQEVSDIDEPSRLAAKARGKSWPV